MGSWEFMSLVFPRVNVSILKKKTSSKNNNPAGTGYWRLLPEEHREPGRRPDAPSRPLGPL